MDSPPRRLQSYESPAGDGKLDLAALAATASCRCASGGVMAAGGTGLLTVASGAMTLAVADLTNDGKVDVVVGSDRGYPPSGGSTIPGGGVAAARQCDTTLQPPQGVSLFPLWGDSLAHRRCRSRCKSDILAFGDSMLLPIYGRGGGLFFEDRQFPAAINAVTTRDVNGIAKAILSLPRFLRIGLRRPQYGRWHQAPHRAPTIPTRGRRRWRWPMSAAMASWT